MEKYSRKEGIAVGGIKTDKGLIKVFPTEKGALKSAYKYANTHRDDWGLVLSVISHGEHFNSYAVVRWDSKHKTVIYSAMYSDIYKKLYSDGRVGEEVWSQRW